MVIKKLLTLTLSLFMTFSLCLNIRADDEKTYVAQIGEIKYETLQNAINNAEPNDKITVLKNIECLTTLTVGINANITIDLNGNVVSAATNSSDSLKHYYILENKGTLTLEDSVGTGKMSSRGIDNYGTLTINGGTYESIDSGNGGASVWNNSNATLTINGGTLSVPNGQNDMSSRNGAQCIYNQYGNVEIYGGLIESNSTYVYAIVNTGSIKIAPKNNNDVIINGTKGGLGVNGGLALINGGEFSSSDYYGLYVSNDGSGRNPEQAVVTVNGGTFDGKICSVWIGSDYNNPVNSSIEINNGTFNKGINAQENTRVNAILVKGGVYKSDVTKYLAEGYNIAKVGDVYKVTKNGDTLPVDENTPIVPAVEEGTVEAIAKSQTIKGLDSEGKETTVTVNSDSTKIELESKPETLSTEETKKVESVKEAVIKELNVDTSKEELKYIPLDITLKAITGETTSTITDLGKNSNGEDVEITVTLYLNEGIAKALKDKTVKVIRIHNGETTVLPATLTNNALTFKTGKFSTYVIAYAETTSKSNDSTSTKTALTKSYSSKDKNQDGVISCEEEMESANWIWSESKQACVYKVTNTNTK